MVLWKYYDGLVIMNKESTGEECIETNSSLKITPDIFKVRSLMDTAA